MSIRFRSPLTGLLLGALCLLQGCMTETLSSTPLRAAPTRAQFALADCDADGALSEAEADFFWFGSAPGSGGFVRTNVDFKQADTNWNGMLSYEELSYYLARTPRGWVIRHELDPTGADCDKDGSYSLAELGGVIVTDDKEPDPLKQERRFTLAEMQAADKDKNWIFTPTEFSALLRPFPCGKHTYGDYCSVFGSATPPLPDSAAGAYFVGWGPYGVAIDSQGAFWVANAWDNQVVKVSPEGRVLNKTWVKKLHGKLALDHDGNVWVTQLDPPNTVTKISPDGKVLGSYEVGIAPLDLTIDAAGNVWVIGSYDLRVLSPDGATRKVLKEGQYGTSIASDTAGRIWITTENKGVRQLSADGKMLFETEIPDGEARDVAIDPEGNAWVYAIQKHAGLPNKANAWVSKVSPEGQILARYDVGNGDGELAFAPDGHLWITLYDQNTVVKLGPDGTQLATYYTGVGPSGIAFDASGHAWVTNHYSHLLKKVTP